MTKKSGITRRKSLAAGCIVLLLAAAAIAADTKISALSAIGTLHSDDLMMDVDVHDNTMGPTGTNKKLTISQLFGSPSNGNLMGWEGAPTPIVVGTGLSLTGTGPYTLSATAGTGTVNSGTGGQVAYYAGNGNTVSGESLSALIDSAIGATQGSVLFRGASSWSALGPGSSGQVLTSAGAAANPSWAATGSGTVTSVGLSLPGVFTVSGSPVTTAGTLTGSLATQATNTVWAGPSSGSAAAPTFRALVGADLPGSAVQSITLNTPGTIYSTPVSFSVSAGAASGTLSFNTQSANTVFAGPTTGAAAAPAFRGIVAGDLPTTGLTITQHTGSITTDTDGATVTFDCSVSDWHQVQIAGNRTFALANPSVGQQFTIIVQQDATGSRTVTWFSGILWAGGTAPTLTTTASKRDVFTFKTISSGVYLGFVAGQNF